MVKVSLPSCLMFAALLPCVAAAQSGDAKVSFQKHDKLVDADPKDKILRKSPAKRYTLKLDKGQGFRIDMVSDEIDSYLRLEDAAGEQLASDNNSGGLGNARIIFQPKESGVYHIIATTVKPKGNFKRLGTFMLTVMPASALELLEMRAKNISSASPSERSAVLAELTSHFKTLGAKLSERDMELARAVGAALELKTPKLAMVAYQDFATIFGASGAPGISKVGLIFEGYARRLDLPGKKLEIKGTALDGRPIDLAKLAGKVVLIDFWATWSVPSLEEFPKLRLLFDAYHERGFEILTINLDQEKDVPSKFMKSRNLPWPCLHDGRSDGKSHSTYYGVSSLPRGFLINREGRVVSLNALGRELERLLEEHIGPFDKN